MSSTSPQNNTSSTKSTSLNRYTDQGDTTSSAAQNYFQKQIMENVSSLVRGLVAFKRSKEAMYESSRFIELWRKLNEVYADVHELGNTSVLNHEPTIAEVGNMLPSNSSKN